MKAQDVMTPNPACCTPETSLREVAQMFVDHDCGAIPIVADAATRTPVGIVTDRDIACRAIAAGKNALDLNALDCMSTPCVTVLLDSSLDECCEAMERNQVRRLLVVDREGQCVGVISQADIVLRGKEKKAVEVLKEVSRPTASASAVAS
jgi:CBS domain-containing protein